MIAVRLINVTKKVTNNVDSLILEVSYHQRGGVAILIKKNCRPNVIVMQITVCSHDQLLATI